jgi:hypothetical protein
VPTIYVNEKTYTFKDIKYVDPYKARVMIVLYFLNTTCVLHYFPDDFELLGLKCTDSVNIYYLVSLLFFFH